MTYIRSRPTRLSAPPAALVAVLLASPWLAEAAPLPPFTFDTSFIGGAGTFTADNLVISDYSAVTFTGNQFTDTGYLVVTSAQLGTTNFTPTGLNSAYTLYFDFTGAGTTSSSNLATQTFGSFSQLSYTLYGVSGAANFGFSGGTPTTSASGATVLATGNLIFGNVSTSPNPDGTFIPTANVNATFQAAPAEQGFFVSPTPFYNTVSTAFTNTQSEVIPTSNGFLIQQGGGSVNFVSAVPEPGTYAQLLAGLGVVFGLLMRRRKE